MSASLVGSEMCIRDSCWAANARRTPQWKTIGNKFLRVSALLRTCHFANARGPRKQHGDESPRLCGTAA
eukprot:1792021-Alexandrium_andersonii.AAC.1